MPFNFNTITFNNILISNVKPKDLEQKRDVSIFKLNDWKLVNGEDTFVKKNYRSKAPNQIKRLAYSGVFHEFKKNETRTQTYLKSALNSHFFIRHYVPVSLGILAGGISALFTAFYIRECTTLERDISGGKTDIIYQNYVFPVLMSAYTIGYTAGYITLWVSVIPAATVISFLIIAPIETVVRHAEQESIPDDIVYDTPLLEDTFLFIASNYERHFMVKFIPNINIQDISNDFRRIN